MRPLPNRKVSGYMAGASNRKKAPICEIGAPVRLTSAQFVVDLSGLEPLTSTMRM